MNMLEGNHETFKKYERPEAKYSNESERFKLSKFDKSFTRQYAHIYSARLWLMRPRLENAAKNAWGQGVPVRPLSDLRADEDCIVVGTLFKVHQSFYLRLNNSILVRSPKQYMFLIQLCFSCIVKQTRILS